MKDEEKTEKRKNGDYEYIYIYIENCKMRGNPRFLKTENYNKILWSAQMKKNNYNKYYSSLAHKRTLQN